MNVFISYRRDDTQDLAGRIADRLRAVGPIKRVFIDVDGIEPGADFARRIQTSLAESTVCILLIGPRWRGETDAGGRARILEEGDFVRREAAAALATDRKILPVLAAGASMPRAEDLPPELQRLPAINALSIRHADFDRDMAHLVDVVLSRKKPGTLRAYMAAHPIQALALRALTGAAAALSAVLVGAAIHQAIFRRSLDETLGGAGPVWLLIGVAVAAGVTLMIRRERDSNPR